MGYIEPYTVALTSCGRFDLLERTLDSLLPRLDGPISKIIIIEDSGNMDVVDVIRPFARGLNEEGYLASGSYLGDGIGVLLNKTPIGQILSIDRLYSHIDTKWIFHCEDDWEFYGNNFIEKSFVLLKRFEKVSMVGIRDLNEYNKYRFSTQNFEHSGVCYKTFNESYSYEYMGISFNPGLRRMRDYQLTGSYADIGVDSSERRVSNLYSRLGYSYIVLCDSATRHIGDSSSVLDKSAPRGFRSKLQRSIRKRLDKISSNFDPNHDPIQRASRRLKHQEVELISVNS